jgi:DNA-binding SARP family transcriptional activator
LRDTSGQQSRRLLRRPKLVALLAYLAAARPHGFHRRDRVVAVFWPELDQAHARNALRQAVHHLRAALGPDVIVTRGDEELAVDPSRLRSDVARFAELSVAGQWAEALELARGELLPGFHLSDTPEFERWLDEERAHVQRRVAEGAATLAEAEATRHNLVGAARWARRAVEAAPYDEDGIRRLLRLLDGAGDRAGAVQAYETFARRLDEDLGVEPAPESQALITAIRARILEHETGTAPASSRAEAATEPIAPALHAEASGPAAEHGRRAEWAWRSLPGAGAVGAAVVAILALADPTARAGIAVTMGYRGTLLAGAGLLLIVLSQWGRKPAENAPGKTGISRGGRGTAGLAGYGLLAAGLGLPGYVVSASLVVVVGLVTVYARTRARRTERRWQMLLGVRGGALQLAVLIAALSVEGRLTAQAVQPRSDTINVFVVLSFEPSTTLSPTLAMRLWQTYVRTFTNVFSDPTFLIHPRQFTAETYAQFTLQETPEREIVQRLLELRPAPDLVLTSAVRFDEEPDFVRIGSFVRRVQGQRLSTPLTDAIVQEGHVDDAWHHALIAATTFLAAIEQDAGVPLSDSVEQDVLRHTLDLFADGIATQTDAGEPPPALDSLRTVAAAGSITAFDVLSVLSEFSHEYDTPDDAARRRSALAKVFGR